MKDHPKVHDGQDAWLADPNRPAGESPESSSLQPSLQVEETALGTPVQEAHDPIPIAEAESLLRQAHRQYEAEPDPQLEAQLTVEGRSWAGIFRKSGLTSLVLGLSALGLLVLAVQALSFVSYLEALPGWVRITGYGVGGLLTFLVLFFLARFLGSYFRLQKSPRISMEALSQLSARSNLRMQAAKLLDQAKEQMARLLESYPLDSGKGRKQMLKLGFTPGNLELLSRNRRQLLESAAEESCEGWLLQVETRFVSIVDQTAKKRITRYAWLVGLKTAAAPTGFVDAAIVLINAYRLMDDLCRIYRLRAGGWGTASILMRIFVNAFAAARLEEWMDNASQHIVDAAAQGSDGMAAFFKVISGGVLSRAAEGGANAFLLVRLGAAGMHYLRPLAEKPSP